MKKGKRYSKTKIFLYTIFHSGFVPQIALSFSSTVLSIIAIILEKKNVLLFLIALITTLSILLKSIITLSKEYFNKRTVYKNFVKEDVVKSTKELTTSAKNNGYFWEDFNGEHYLTSNSVNSFLLNNTLSIKINYKKPKLRKEQREVLYNTVFEKINQGKNIFNANLVGLKSDLSTLNTEITVEKTDYFSNITSNDLIYYQITSKDSYNLYDGKKITLDNKGRLLDIENSPASNILGASTIAITTDGYLLVNQQNGKNDVNEGCYVPTGSGSVDFNDLNYKLVGEDKKHLLLDQKIVENEIEDYLNGVKNETDFKNFYKKPLPSIKYNFVKDSINDFSSLIIRAMERELMEESHLTEKDILGSFIYGYIRLLNRGGKPDFFGITFLNLTKDEALNKFYTQTYINLKKELVSKSSLTDFSEAVKQTAYPLEKVYGKTVPKDYDENKLSVQLYYSLNFIGKNQKIIEEKLKEFKKN
ncbi:MAG: hypothetical protein E7342_04460 [Clostridiales bacterium]|nr:hypothetical protein [Clostridiales bacterium]